MSKMTEQHFEILKLKERISELEKENAELKDLLEADKRNWVGHCNEIEKHRDQLCSDLAKLREAFALARTALEDCRKASKVNGPTIDKMIIRNITGTALAQLDQRKRG